MKIILMVLMSIASLQIVAAREFRELTNLSGKKIKAELLELSEGRLKIRANSRVFQVDLDTLSAEDQRWLAEWDAKGKGGEDDLYYKELIFEDDFSNETFDERWTHYKSASEVKDGVFNGITSPDSDHQAVDTIKFEGRQDMAVSVKFKFSGPEAKRFTLKFDDNQYKGAHAGHICRVSVSPSVVALQDGKTGVFKNEIFDMRRSEGGMDEDTKTLLESKISKEAVELKMDEWHDLLLQTKADVMTVLINGKKAGQLKSEGIAHASKSSVGMATPGIGVSYDDFVVRSGK